MNNLSYDDTLKNIVDKTNNNFNELNDDILSIPIGEDALKDIENQRLFAVSGINKLGNDTLSSVSAKAASAKKEIDEKASNTIASIPSDYATLTSKVSSLKLYRDTEGYLCEEE